MSCVLCIEGIAWEDTKTESISNTAISQLPFPQSSLEKVDVARESTESEANGKEKIVRPRFTVAP